MSAPFAQKAIIGFVSLAIAAGGAALPSTDAKAAPLIFDCYSLSTSDLLMKSALDLSNENLACVQNGVGTQVSDVPASSQQGDVTPAPGHTASAGASFFGSVIGSALGSVLSTAINGANRNPEEHHSNDQGQDQPVKDRDGSATAQQPEGKVTLPGGITSKVNVINPNLRKPIQLPGASGRAAAGNPSTGSNPSRGVLPGGTKIGVLNPSLSNLGNRLLF